MYALPHAAAPVLHTPLRSVPAESGRVVGATTVLFREGDAADAVYEVLAGVFRATKIFPDGRRQVVAFAYPGDIIGFGHGQTYRFDCEALTPGKIEITARGDVLRAAALRPDLGQKLLAQAAHELSSMHDLSTLLCRKSAMERIAGFLMSLAARTGKLGNDRRIALPMCRADIADHLGLTIETVSRNLTKLRVRGIVDLPDRGSFVVRDLDRLEALAECETRDH